MTLDANAAHIQQQLLLAANQPARLNKQASVAQTSIANTQVIRWGSSSSPCDEPSPAFTMVAPPSGAPQLKLAEDCKLIDMLKADREQQEQKK